MNEPSKPFDPLDPGHRIEQQRERFAFFRQTDIFLIVVLTMLAFVPLAVWQKPWALPFLGWMAVVPWHVAVIWSSVAGKRDTPVKSLKTAPIAAILFLVVATIYYPAVWILGIGIVVYGIVLWIRSELMT